MLLKNSAHTVDANLQKHKSSRKRPHPVIWRRSGGLMVGLEAAAPVLGLQDTGSGGNRVLRKTSGTSRLTIKGEQKSGHFIFATE